jgi:hypothetical protein
VAPAPSPVAVPVRRSAGLAALPRWWHLLSLDAPTVAAVWSWSIGLAAGIHLPWTALLLLVLGTWLVYVADRILDGLLATPSALRERHFFYARHRIGFLIASAPVTALLLWLIVARMNPTARFDDIAVFSAALIYFCIVHMRGPAAERWLPKELAVGIVFAAATAVPAWSRLPMASAGGSISVRVILIVVTLFFAALCWLNCVAIEKWERARQILSEQLMPHSTTRWAQKHLQPLCIAVALAAVSSAVLGRVVTTHAGIAAIFLASAMAAMGLAALDRWQAYGRRSGFHLRIAADAAMLTPLIFFLVIR